MNKSEDRIFLVDDDEDVLRGISLLLRSYGYHVESYSDPKEFLNREYYPGSGCILLDVFMADVNGLELQEGIKKRFDVLPVIYISGKGDIPMSVQAVKKGAINFLQKPIPDHILTKAIDEALEESRRLLSDRDEFDLIRSRMYRLTPRELEIFKLLITGMLNKQIAAELTIEEHTVKIHRGRITRKLGVKSVAEMVFIAAKLFA